jgi:death on curing protein
VTPWNHLISLDRVLELHQRGLLEHSQAVLAVGELAKDCVDGRLGNAWTSETYRADEDDIYPGLCFCGFLLYYLVRGHCFPDGNKRVAWASAMAVLASIGLTINATDDESYDLVIGIAEARIRSGMEVVQWLGRKLEAPEA